MSEEKRSQAELSGERIVFTGKLASMTRGQALQIVRSLGGTVESNPSKDTTLVVFGQDGWPLQRDGRLTRKLGRWSTPGKISRSLQNRRSSSGRRFKKRQATSTATSQSRS